jgi:shikimate dehydrogenase
MQALDRFGLQAGSLVLGGTYRLAVTRCGMVCGAMTSLTARARLAGVVGWPVSHSRSPLLHNHWLARYGIDGAYVPLPVRPEDLASEVARLRAAGFRGVNVTVPHKVAVAALCDELRPAALRAGAVNTLVFTEAGVVGDNTDGAGFLANLRAHAAPFGPALLLGAGGAARAIAAALLAEGVAVTIANRTPAHAADLAAVLPGLRTIPWHERHALGGVALLVNTTSLGMTGQPPLEMDLAGAPPGMAVCDIVYAPLETRLLAAARVRGLLAVGGLGMLLHQAAPGFAAWFGVQPDVDAALYDLVASDLAAAGL